MAVKYPGLLVPEADKHQALYQGLLGMGSALSGGPSNAPVSFAQQLGRGGQSFNKSYQDRINQSKQDQMGNQKYQMQQAQMEAQKMKIEEAKRQQAEAARIKLIGEQFANSSIGMGGIPGGDAGTEMGPTIRAASQQEAMTPIDKYLLETNPAAFATSQKAAQTAANNRAADLQAKKDFEPFRRFAPPAITNFNTDRQLPKGWTMNPDGTASPIKGGPVDPDVVEKSTLAKQATESVEAMPGIRKGIVTKTDRLPILQGNVKDIKNMAESWFTSGLPGQAMGMWSGSDQYRLEAKLNTLKSAIGLQELIDVKAAGATFGSLTENEMTLLISSVGALDANLGPTDIGPTLDTIVRLYEKGLKQSQRDFSKKYPTATTPWGEIPPPPKDFE